MEGGGGGECRFYFHGRGDFSDFRVEEREAARKPTSGPTFWPISRTLPKPTFELLLGYCISGLVAQVGRHNT